jgi:hypothetical protein
VSKVGSFAWSNADFERFVYADVATEPSGMELSVLSALSRRDLDPWQETQRLAQLPPSAAADGLAQTLSAVPAVQALRLDVKVIAERLVVLPRSPDCDPMPPLRQHRSIDEAGRQTPRAASI